MRAVVKNEWSYTSTVPYTFMSYTETLTLQKETKIRKGRNEGRYKRESKAGRNEEIFKQVKKKQNKGKMKK
jgi:hypothetical protein